MSLHVNGYGEVVEAIFEPTPAAVNVISLRINRDRPLDRLLLAALRIAARRSGRRPVAVEYVVTARDRETGLGTLELGWRLDENHYPSAPPMQECN